MELRDHLTPKSKTGVIMSRMGEIQQSINDVRSFLLEKRNDAAIEAIQLIDLEEEMCILDAISAEVLIYEQLPIYIKSSPTVMAHYIKLTTPPPQPVDDEDHDE